MAGKGGGGEWEKGREEEEEEGRSLSSKEMMMMMTTKMEGGSDDDDDSHKIKSKVVLVDEQRPSLRRLQSLLFGAEKAVDNKGGGGRDFNAANAAAYILSLRLLGFLNSQQQHSESSSSSSLFFVRSILLRSSHTFFNHAKLHLLSSDDDRRAFEQAGKDPGRIFRNNGEMDIEKKIKHSNYFQLLLSHPSKTPDDCQPLDQVNRQEERQEDKPTCKTSKNLVQAKLTSLYGNNNNNNNIRPNNSSPNIINVTSKGNGSEDCTIIEKSLSSYKFPKRQGTPAFPRVEDDERGYYGNNVCGTKRLHSETRSPENMFIKSPTSTTKEANNDVSRNFVTARAKLEMDVRQKRGLMGSPSASMSPQSDNNKIQRGYSYGFSRRGVRGNFVPPIKSNGGNLGNITSRITGKGEGAHDDSTKRCLELLCGPDGELPEKLRNLEPRLIEHVSNEIMDRDPYVRWDDIAGLNHAKKCITEMVIWPLMRPDIFKGCRSPGRGLLLFGPPGTGKTMIGKAIAGEAKATFFYISASSLTSKWIGEGEKLVRALFGVASCRRPAVIFVDEIDSLLSQRKSEGEHESSRRLKTQFLIEMEGFDSGSEQVLLVGATNRPQELDEAARRRLTKRLYIPLPSSEARAWIIQNLLKKDGLFELSSNDTDTICRLTDGYSGSDMKNLVKDASMGPLREAMRQGIDISELKKEDMRPVTLQDFEDSLQQVRPSVSLSELGTYEEWNKQFGSLSL